MHTCAPPALRGTQRGIQLGQVEDVVRKILQGVARRVQVIQQQLGLELVRRHRGHLLGGRGCAVSGGKAVAALAGRASAGRPARGHPRPHAATQAAAARVCHLCGPAALAGCSSGRGGQLLLHWLRQRPLDVSHVHVRFAQRIRVAPNVGRRCWLWPGWCLIAAPAQQLALQRGPCSNGTGARGWRVRGVALLAGSALLSIGTHQDAWPAAASYAHPPDCRQIGCASAWPTLSHSRLRAHWIGPAWPCPLPH